MIYLETEEAKRLLFHLASAAKRIEEQRSPEKLLQKERFYNPKAVEERIKKLETKLKEVDSIEDSFERLRRKYNELERIKKEEELAFAEIKREKTTGKPQLTVKLALLENKYRQLLNKGYSKKDLKKVKEKIDELKKKL